MVRKVEEVRADKTPRCEGTRRFRDAMWLGIGFALQGLCSVYVMVFSTWMLLFAVLARAKEWMRGEGIALITRLAAAAGTNAKAIRLPRLA